MERLPHVTAMTATVWGNSEIGGNGRLRRTTVNGVGAGMLSYVALRRLGCSALSSSLGTAMFCLNSQTMVIMAGGMETPMVLWL